MREKIKELEERIEGLVKNNPSPEIDEKLKKLRRKLNEIKEREKKRKEIDEELKELGGKLNTLLARGSFF